jgi:triosephosphate isomerase
MEEGVRKIVMVETGQPGVTWIGVSTKMYLGYDASLAWLRQVRDIVAHRPELVSGGPVQLFLIPSFPVLDAARALLADVPVHLGAQNCAWGDGPLTGEVSPAMLAELGVRLVEIGHAERRTQFAEDDAVVARKAAAALAAGLTPLLCVGEPERSTPEEAAAFCARQVLSAQVDPASVILAYEPVWAIGAPAPAPADYVNATITALRGELKATPAEKVQVVYGGSAGPGLLNQLDAADGLFLGRFAHDPANLGKVLDEALARPR